MNDEGSTKRMTYPNDSVEGMTKREYFSAHAMAGIVTLGIGAWTTVGGDRDDNRARNFLVMTKYAVEIADALIKELNTVTEK